MGTGPMAELVGALSNAPKSGRFDSRSEHIPRLRVPSPLGAHMGGNQWHFSHQCFSLPLFFYTPKKQINFVKKKKISLGEDLFKKLVWLVWFSGLSTSLQTKRSPVQFPVRTQAWVAGQVPSWGAQEATSRHLSHQCFSPSFSPSLPLSLKINKIFLKSSLYIML